MSSSWGKGPPLQLVSFLVSTVKGFVIWAKFQTWFWKKFKVPETVRLAAQCSAEGFSRLLAIHQLHAGSRPASGET
jgi:hypothetical protein